MKIASLPIVISLIALVFGLLVILYVNFEGIQNVGRRSAAPDFFLRNRFLPVLEGFKDHLEAVREFSSVLKQLERERVGPWIMSTENGVRTFISPYSEVFSKLQTLFFIETGKKGSREIETVDLFGTTVTKLESVDYGVFILSYVPGYTLVMESDYNSILEEGFEFGSVHFMNSFSPGKFVSDVFSGAGPVVVLKEGTSVSQLFLQTVERYSIPFLPVRHFLIKN
ncbi:hypothetical protein [Mesotoga sp.]|uniref:hypothetical protein n=1 Tax=Mesotoga sp. TaxID=2053577 RepID=UPI00345E86D3